MENTITTGVNEIEIIGGANYWLGKAKEAGDSTVFVPEILEGKKHLTKSDCLRYARYYYEEIAYCFPSKEQHYLEKAYELRTMELELERA